MGKNDVFLGNLPSSVTEDEIRELFEGFDILDVRILNRDGKSFGFLSLSNDEEVERAVSEKHGTEIHGRRLVARNASDSKQSDNRRGDDRESRPRRNRNDNDDNRSGDRPTFGSYSRNESRPRRDRNDNEESASGDRPAFGNYNRSESQPPPLAAAPIKTMPPLYVDKDLFEMYRSKHLEIKNGKEEGGSEETDQKNLAPDFSTLDLSSTFKVYVSNFPFHTNENLLLKLFNQWNPIAIDMVNNGRPHDDPEEVTEAHVYFSTELDMLGATKVNGVAFRGRPLAVLAENDELDDSLEVYEQQFIQSQSGSLITEVLTHYSHQSTPKFRQNSGDNTGGGYPHRGGRGMYSPHFRPPQTPRDWGYMRPSLLGTPPFHQQTPYRPGGYNNFTPFVSQFRPRGRF